MINKSILSIVLAFSLSGCSALFIHQDENHTAYNKKSDYVGGYYFGYKVNGVNNIQIFDDTTTTYLQLPSGIIVNNVWMYEGDQKYEELFDYKEYSVQIPKVSMRVVVLTNYGLFVAERNQNIPYVSTNKKLEELIIMTKIKELMSEISIIKNRIVQRLELLK
jgi:hypothetical protein